ncbi:MAG: DegV family protein [Lachnospiraceae bacterium]|nr:DegV family protein [Lachnospiraceae bacterium]
MRQNYVLSCCSTVDLTKEHLDGRDIHYVCMHYSLDGKEYFDDLGQSMPFDLFYRKMQEGAETKTSQVNVEEFLNYFRPFLEQGLDVLHASLSSGISGTYNSACIARDMLLEEFPDRKLLVVDSLAASSGYGLLMELLADKRDAGASLEELYDWALANRLTIHHWFFSTDLTFYIKGGRVSKTSGFIGNLLNICPLLNVDDEGKLIPRSKIRGKRAVIRQIVERMKEHAEGGTSYSGKCYMCHSACYEDARAVADLVEAAFPNLTEPVQINDIGTTIGSHTGPGTVALFFIGDVRVH